MREQLFLLCERASGTSVLLLMGIISAGVSQPTKQMLQIVSWHLYDNQSNFLWIWFVFFVEFARQQRRFVKHFTNLMFQPLEWPRREVEKKSIEFNPVKYEILSRTSFHLFVECDTSYFDNLEITSITGYTCHGEEYMFATGTCEATCESGYTSLERFVCEKGRGFVDHGVQCQRTLMKRFAHASSTVRHQFRHASIHF